MSETNERDLTQEEAWALGAALLERAEAERARRAEEMPTAEDAVRALFRAYQRLKELGFRDARYVKQGARGEAVSAGSTGIHKAQRDATGGVAPLFWVVAGGDVWPEYPVLFREVPDAD